MTLFKKTIFYNFLILSIISCSIVSNNTTTSQAYSYTDLETVETKKLILDDIGLTRKDLASKEKPTDISEELSGLIPKNNKKQHHHLSALCHGMQWELYCRNQHRLCSYFERTALSEQ